MPDTKRLSGILSGNDMEQKSIRRHKQQLPGNRWSLPMLMEIR